jgi:RNA polymerase sigma-70 factor (ECF subfamily)
VEPAADESDPPGDAVRLGAQAARMRWVALQCAGRALLRRLEVDDLVQEAMLRAWQDRGHWPAYERGDGDLQRWLATLVRHATIDAARASRAKKRGGGDVRVVRGEFSRSGLDLGDLPAQTAGPATRAGGGETRRALEQAFLRLSGEHRRVLALRQFEGLSAAEAATRTGLSEVAVHSAFRRALQAWERELGRGFSILGDELAPDARSHPA